MKKKINIEIEDRQELQALHKTLMEAKFHKQPEQPIIQASPMVANIMHKVVDELEKLNYVTEFEKKHRNIDWKNGWAEWRENPSDSLVIPCLKQHMQDIETINQESEEKYMKFVAILLAPYKISKDKMQALVDKSRAVN